MDQTVKKPVKKKAAKKKAVVTPKNECLFKVAFDAGWRASISNGYYSPWMCRWVPSNKAVLWKAFLKRRKAKVL